MQELITFFNKNQQKRLKIEFISKVNAFFRANIYFIVANILSPKPIQK